LTANLFQLVFGICWLPLSFPVYAMTSPSDKGISQKSYQNSRMRLSSVGKKRQKDIELSFFHQSLYDKIQITSNV